MTGLATSLPSAVFDNAIASIPGDESTARPVVEVELLLPSDWMRDLLRLSIERGQSVAQVLRSMIGQALDDETCRAG